MGADLDPVDREALDHARAEVEAAKHRAWLLQVIRRSAAWVAGIIGGLTLVVDGAIRLWKLLRETIL